MEKSPPTDARSGNDTEDSLPLYYNTNRGEEGKWEEERGMAKQQQTRKYTRSTKAEKDKATHVDGKVTFNGCKIRKRHRGQLIVTLQFKASLHMHSTTKSQTNGRSSRGMAEQWQNTGAVQKNKYSFRRPRGGGEVGEEEK